MTGFQHGKISQSAYPNPLIYRKIMSVKNYIQAVIVKCKVHITKPKGTAVKLYTHEKRTFETSTKTILMTDNFHCSEVLAL
jgi:hypothetical protein